MNSLRRPLAGLSVAAATALLAGLVAGAGIGIAASHVPKVTNVSATPARFCVKSSSTCASPGTTVRFHISTNARVLINYFSEERNDGPLKGFERHFNAGTRSFRLSDPAMASIPGRWRIKIQGVNNVGAGTLGFVDVRVYK